MNIILIISILILTIIFVFKNSKNDRISRINSKIPGPWGLPIFGNLLSMGGDLHLKFEKHYQKYGTVFSIKMGKIHTVVLTEYPTLRSAFIENAEAFQSRYQLPSRVQANGAVDIAMENGEKHALLKKVILSEVTPSKVRKMESHISLECEKLIKLLDQHAIDGKPFFLNDYLSMFALNITLRFLFGSTSDFPYNQVEQSQGIIHAVKDFALNVGNPILSDFLPLIKQPKTNIFMEKLQVLNVEVDKMIKKYLNQKEISQTEKDDSIIGKLINEYEKGKITWECITNTCIDLVLAGSDTSANTILFCLIELTNNQDIQSKLYNTIKTEIINSRGEYENDNNATRENDIKVVTYSKFHSSIPYLNMILRETYRKYPVAPFALPHLLTKDVVIDGYDIAAGTQIILNLYATHRSEKYYPSPNEFIPERFLNNNEQNNLVNFGIGPRDCIGKNLANTEIFSLLATLFNRYEFINPSTTTPINSIGKFGLAYLPLDTNIILKKR